MSQVGGSSPDNRSDGSYGEGMPDDTYGKRTNNTVSGAKHRGSGNLLSRMLSKLAHLDRSTRIPDKDVVKNHHGNGDSLLRILSKLGYLDLSNRILDKNAAKNAHGGYCDVFIGYVPLDYLQDWRIIVANGARVKVAIKHLRIRLNREEEFAKRLAREMAIWSRLDHPNILPFLGYTLEEDYPSLISEWMESGTAREYLKTHPDADIVRLALGISKGLQYMHDKDFIHSDLKADNVLIGPSGEALLCDFGISRALNSSESWLASSTREGDPRGSVRWMAIELHIPGEGLEPKHTKETDVWAFGMTLYELMARELPYAHLKQDVHVLTVVMKGILPILPGSPIDTRLSRSARSAICTVCRGCWDKSAEKRPTMVQIVGTLSSLFNSVSEQHIRSGLVDAGQQKPSSGRKRNTRHGMSVVDCDLGYTPTYQSQYQDSDTASSTLLVDLDVGRNGMVQQSPVVGIDGSSEIDDDRSNLEHHRRNDNSAEQTNAEEGATIASPDDRFEALEALASSLVTRFKHSGDIAYLTEAIDLRRFTLSCQPEEYPYRALWLDNLGYTLSLRFERIGDIDDITESIESHRSALALRPEGHPHRSPSLNNLGNSLSLRFERTHDIDDITEAIEANRCALALRPIGHPNHSVSLNNLGHSLFLRFRCTGDIEDITESIESHRSALALRPEGHPDRSVSLHNLGHSLFLRFERTHDIDDITESIEANRSALALRSEGHSDRSLSLHSLGNSLSLRFERSGDIDDITESIESHRSALALRPEGNSNRSESLNELGNSLSLRFKRTGDIRDIAESVELYRSTLALWPEGHSDHSRLLNNLVDSLSSRFDKSGNIEDLEELTRLRCTAVSQGERHS